MNPLVKMLLSWFFSMLLFLASIGGLMWIVSSETFRNLTSFNSQVPIVVFLIGVMILGSIYTRVLTKSMKEFQQTKTNPKK